MFGCSQHFCLCIDGRRHLFRKFICRCLDTIQENYHLSFRMAHNTILIDSRAFSVSFTIHQTLSISTSFAWQSMERARSSIDVYSRLSLLFYHSQFILRAIENLHLSSFKTNISVSHHHSIAKFDITAAASSCMHFLLWSCSFLCSYVVFVLFSGPFISIF